MNETNNEQNQKPCTSKAANASIVSLLVGLLLLGLMALLFYIAPKNWEGSIIFLLAPLATTVCFLVTTILSIAGIVSILRNKEILAGIKRAIISLLICVVFWTGLGCLSFELKRMIDVWLCMERLFAFRAAIYHDPENVDGYVFTTQWSDSLLDKVGEQLLHCPRAKGTKCSYALNKNLIGMKHSEIPGDVVVFFETDGGWNQVGGPELLGTQNHNGKGSSIMFGDRRVDFVRKEDFSTLRWEP